MRNIEATPTPLWLIGLAAISLLAFAIEAWQIISFPGFMFEGPWQGLHIVAAARVLEGLTLYPDPYLEASYYVYSPLLPWIHAGFLTVFGKSILSMKLSALLACLAIFGGIYQLSRQLGATIAASVVAVAFFVAFFQIMLFWHLSVRPDTIATAFVLWGVVAGFAAVRTQSDNRQAMLAIASGALLAAAALCKQPFGIMGIAFFAYLAYSQQHRVTMFCVVTWMFCGAAMTLPYILGDEYFLTSMLILQAHESYTVLHTVLSNQPLMLLLAIPLALIFIYRKETGPLPFITVGALMMGFIGTSKWGGNINAYLCLVALMGPVLAYQLSQEEPVPKTLIALTTSVLIVFFVAGSFNRIVNHTEDTNENVTRFTGFLENNADKTIYFPVNNYLTYLYADQYHHCDWMSENLVRAGQRPPDSFLLTMVEQHYDYIVGPFSTNGLNEFRGSFYAEDPISQTLGFPVFSRLAQVPPPQ